MNLQNQKLRVAVVQDGARLHYAIPLALQRLGALECVFTDWYSRPGSLPRLLARLMKLTDPAVGQKMLDRYCPELRGAKVFSSISRTWRADRARKHFDNDRAYYMWEARERGRWIVNKGFGQANSVLGFVTNIAPEVADVARKRGLVAVGDQIIAPYEIEMEEERIQRERWPEWAGAGKACTTDAEWIEFERGTWGAVDRVTCASDYVRDGMVRCGVVAEKIAVNPYPVDATHFPEVDRSRRSGPLTVGFVGSVSLRKGTPYFFEVARHFDPAKVRFVMVGPVGINAKGIEKKGNVELVGPVPRSAIFSWLEKFDLYFFPSTCEGSAASVMEAMMTGLPVVCSPNSGSVVRDGTDGRIVRYDDIHGAVAAIRAYTEDAAKRTATGHEAATRARGFSLDGYGQELIDVVAGVRQMR